jgi:hypothetical protein
MAMFEVGAIPAALELFRSDDEETWRKGLGKQIYILPQKKLSRPKIPINLVYYA